LQGPGDPWRGRADAKQRCGRQRQANAVLLLMDVRFQGRTHVEFYVPPGQGELLTLYHGTELALGRAMALTIGRLAKAAGVGVQTIRYYERRGLLAKPGRTGSGYRLFADEAVRRVEFIRRAQRLGFQLEEVRELLSLRVAPGGRCAGVEHAAAQARERVHDRLRELERIDTALGRLIGACRERRETDECPILEALEGGIHSGER
jgi:Hg(II)-responsive transcriptional regulator